MSRRIKILFTLSVLLNVLLLGLGAGFAVKEAHEHQWLEARGDDLPPDIKAVMATHYQQMHHDMQPLIDASQQAHEELGAVLKSQDFDMAKFNEVAQRIADLRSRMGAQRMEAMRQLVAQLSADQRQMMADHFAGRVEWGRQYRWTCKPDKGAESNIQQTGAVQNSPKQTP